MLASKTAAEAFFPGIATPDSSREGFWKSVRLRFAKARCRWIHRSISRPVNGKYRCWTCLQEFETGW